MPRHGHFYFTVSVRLGGNIVLGDKLISASGRVRELIEGFIFTANDVNVAATRNSRASATLTVGHRL